MQCGHLLLQEVTTAVDWTRRFEVSRQMQFFKLTYLRRKKNERHYLLTDPRTIQCNVCLFLFEHIIRYMSPGLILPPNCLRATLLGLELNSCQIKCTNSRSNSRQRDRSSNKVLDLHPLFCSQNGSSS